MAPALSTRLIRNAQYGTDLHRCHDLLDFLVVELEDTVQDTDLVIAQGLFALTVESEERLELGFLVSVRLIVAEDPVEEFGNRPCNWGWGENAAELVLSLQDKRYEPKRYIMALTTGAQEAPIESP